jgi:hypothetical protein
VFLLTGCARQVGKDDLPGTYEFTLDAVKQTVVVSQDGQYTNTLYKDGLVVWSDRQQWTYEQQAGKYGITFAAFRFGIPGHSAEPGLWFVVPSKTLAGSKELCFDTDLGRCFTSR